MIMISETELTGDWNEQKGKLKQTVCSADG